VLTTLTVIVLSSYAKHISAQFAQVIDVLRDGDTLQDFFLSGGDLNVFGGFVGNHLDVAVGGITNLHGVDVKANELAALALIDLNHGNLPSAIELYGRALAQDYPQVDWRLNLARALAKNGKLDEALHEV